eukprot:12604552-Alexandrium_andersonii.AAC.1
MLVVSAAAQFKLRTPEAIVRFRAAAQPGHLCSGQAGAQPVSRGSAMRYIVHASTACAGVCREVLGSVGSVSVAFGSVGRF